MGKCSKNWESVHFLLYLLSLWYSSRVFVFNRLACLVASLLSTYPSLCWTTATWPLIQHYILSLQSLNQPVEPLALFDLAAPLSDLPVYIFVALVHRNLHRASRLQTHAAPQATLYQ